MRRQPQMCQKIKHFVICTLQETNISNLGKRNSSWKIPWVGICDRCQEGNDCYLFWNRFDCEFTWIRLVKAALQCVDRQLEFGNHCELLKEHFRCENGCGHQVGKGISALSGGSRKFKFRLRLGVTLDITSSFWKIFECHKKRSFNSISPSPTFIYKYFKFTIARLSR